MSVPVGDNLTSYPNLEVLSALGAQKLKEQLLQIRLPYNIIAMYAVGDMHFCWITTNHPVTKVIKRKAKTNKGN